jgi:hypothetical protein
MFIELQPWPGGKDMAITSHAFGRVTLTEEDADKFANQVRYGRASKAAKDAVGRGLSMAKSVKDNGKVNFTVAKPARLKGGLAKR